MLFVIQISVARQFYHTQEAIVSPAHSSTKHKRNAWIRQSLFFFNISSCVLCIQKQNKQYAPV